MADVAVQMSDARAFKAILEPVRDLYFKAYGATLNGAAMPGNLTFWEDNKGTVMETCIEIERRVRPLIIEEVALMLEARRDVPEDVVNAVRGMK